MIPAYLLSTTNVWGIPKRDVEAHLCVECMRPVTEGHYSFCPALTLVGASQN